MLGMRRCGMGRTMTHAHKTYRRVALSLVREPCAEYCAALTTPELAARCAAAVIPDAPQEEFWAFYVDAKRRLIAAHMVGRGTLDACLVSPRDVFGPALLCGSASVVVAHRHPSGDPAPSMEDRAMTRRLAQAGALLGIELADSIVIGATSWYSCATDRKGDL